MPAESLLTDSVLEGILTTIPRLTIGVIGDLFLDRYLDIDASLTEASLETGLDAYQVVAVRASPGAAGTVVNNLVALGVRSVCPIAVVGEDGEGFELRQALARLPGVDLKGMLSTPERRTPTYTKPLLHARANPPRELNRLDIKNRQPMSEQTQAQIEATLIASWQRLDALIVLDQVSEAECGVITAHVRERIISLRQQKPSKFVLADSRERIAGFRCLASKPNRREALLAAGIATGDSSTDLDHSVQFLARCTGSEVFCTDGAEGILLATPQKDDQVNTARIPAYPVRGPIDPVGAGDSASAALACARASGVCATASAAFANLVASITIQQIGSTGTATPAQVRQRWQEVR
jgi:rfaE bifunctional protein kinase chain/domain